MITGAVYARAKVDEGLRAERLEVYPQLWELTESCPSGRMRLAAAAT